MSLIQLGVLLVVRVPVSFLRLHLLQVRDEVVEVLALFLALFRRLVPLPRLCPLSNRFVSNERRS